MRRSCFGNKSATSWHVINVVNLRVNSVPTKNKIDELRDNERSLLMFLIESLDSFFARYFAQIQRWIRLEVNGFRGIRVKIKTVFRIKWRGKFWVKRWLLLDISLVRGLLLLLAFYMLSNVWNVYINFSQSARHAPLVGKKHLKKKLFIKQHKIYNMTTLSG